MAAQPKEPYILLTHNQLDRTALIEYVTVPEYGAVTIFEGIVRNNTHQQTTLYLEYEAYEIMAMEVLRRIAEDAQRRWPGIGISVAHRLGRVEIGEASVIIAVGSAHRAEGFAACHYIIDTLKSDVPIWKKEFTPDGSYWVEE